MTYKDALTFWYDRINFEVKSARPADLKLERMRAMMCLLGNPQDRVRLVHVTGTKGKGSTCAMLSQILQSAGYRVGLFTSPHLEHVEERIQVNRVPISQPELVAGMAAVGPVVRQLEQGHAASDATRQPPITFFEIGTALGFLHFCRRRCDVAIIEVGLGGRFDSTNVCRPLVSVITSIGYDHMAQLGHSLDAIAYQKAGIIKRRVPIISGVTQESPRRVIEQVAHELEAPLQQLNRDFHYRSVLTPAGQQVSITTKRDEYGDMILHLVGTHQSHNAAVAVAACEQLQQIGLAIPKSAIAHGLSRVEWSARIEVLSRDPAIILDTAHNAPSAEALVDTLARLFPAATNKAVIVGVSSDKQYAEILRILAGYFDQFYLTRYSNNPRSVPVEKLASVLEEVAPGTRFTAHATAHEAWGAARGHVLPGGLLCVTGSVFLAGELRASMLQDSV